MNDNDMVI